MSDPYLDGLEQAICAIEASGEKVTLFAIAAQLGVSTETAASTFDNGVLKGFWKIELTPSASNLLQRMTDEDRQEVLRDFCRGCGQYLINERGQRCVCHCMNDE